MLTQGELLHKGINPNSTLPSSRRIVSTHPSDVIVSEGFLKEVIRVES